MVPLCVETFVAQAVSKSGPAHPQVYLIRYMDDSLSAEKAQGRLLAACAHLQKAPKKQGFVIAPEKVPTEPPHSF